MQLCETIHAETGRTRYFADGRRISRARMAAIKGGHDLDTFQTVAEGALIRHYSCARSRVATARKFGRVDP